MERLAAYFAEAADAIWRNRLRSFLTVLGMIIGTASIIAVLGLSNAAQSGINGSLASFGQLPTTLAPEPNQDDLASAQIQYGDVARLREATADSVDEIFPVYVRTYAFKANGVSYDTSLAATSGIVRDSLKLASGRRINTGDVDSGAHVMLLSAALAQRFFPKNDAVGQVMRAGGQRFEIIGVYDPLSSSLFSSASGGDYAEIPYTTFHHLEPGPVDYVEFYPRAKTDGAAAQSEVLAEIKRIHRGSKYSIQDTEAFTGGFSKAIGALGIGLSAIGGVALLVAGIGIMNIMLVAVTERTREIGIRKAIGASRRDITYQFLIEALLLSVIGGAIGTLIGIAFVAGGARIIEGYTGPAAIPYFSIVVLAIAFSAIIGTAFGTFPALRAGRLDPIVALRS